MTQEITYSLVFFLQGTALHIFVYFDQNEYFASELWSQWIREKRQNITYQNSLEPADVKSFQQI